MVSSPTSNIYCPACGNAAAAQLSWWGAAFLWETQCGNCQSEFFSTFPTGQFNRFSIAFSADFTHVIAPERGAWLVQQLREASTSPAITENKLRVVRQTTANEAILLSCLDDCYGHALTMLFQAQIHHENSPDTAIIAVVPAALAWLVPDYVAEVWVWEGGFSDFSCRIVALNPFLQNLQNRFDSLTISNAHIHYEHRSLALETFTKTAGFQLENFSTFPPHITFVFRNDRLWLRYGYERFLERIARKFRLNFLNNILIFRQNNRFIEVAKLIKIAYPETNFIVTGIGKIGKFPGFTDLRVASRPSLADEQNWCASYARSQVVVGVHGSNMLLPTGLSAGFVDIVPPEKIPHLGEDILLRHENPIHQSLLGRFLGAEASPKTVANHIVAMLTEFPVWWEEHRQRNPKA